MEDKNNKSYQKTLNILGIVVYCLLFVSYFWELIRIINSGTFFNYKNASPHDFLYTIAEPTSCILLIIICIVNSIFIIANKKQGGLGIVLPIIIFILEKVSTSVSFFFVDGKYYPGYYDLFVVLLMLSTIVFTIGSSINKKPLLVIGLITSILSMAVFAVSIFGQLYYNRNNAYVIFSRLSWLIAFIAVIAEMVIVININKQEKILNSIDAVNLDINNSTEDNTSLIIDYKELLDIGAITQEEFDKKKKELLDL
jgi:uncharacterized membrane protein